jgi:hypothetical protein
MPWCDAILAWAESVTGRHYAAEELPTPQAFGLTDVPSLIAAATA